MSELNNVRFVELVNENFKHSIAIKDWKEAQKDISDLRESGFGKEADQLTGELKTALADERLKIEDINLDNPN